ncbi:protein NATD1-like [Sphaeramia orbicularis]|uniref:Protein NATD1 n=1 Tax=Sphaeramia orbicularis TaxID=375764 RepID=A0A672Y4K5_9TELE|nr:protein NATD1-like [Sphaeramia orbicularis]
MAFTLFSRLTLVPRLGLYPFRSFSSICGLTVLHDRQNQRFTVAPGSGADGPQDHAVLYYKFIGENEVDLMSTYVPESYRGQGVAAILSKAAMDFLVEENLKAHVSCWYIKKYIEEHPLQNYKDLVIT